MPCANYSTMERLSCFMLAYEVRNYKPNEAKLHTYVWQRDCLIYNSFFNSITPMMFFWCHIKRVCLPQMQLVLSCVSCNLGSVIHTK